MSIKYDFIKNEIIKRNYRVKNFIDDFTDMGERGFKMAVDNETLKVSTLQMISRKLKIPMSYWFKEEDKEIVAETEIMYGDNAATIIKELRELLKECNDDKRRLKDQVDELQAKLGEKPARTKAAV